MIERSVSRRGFLQTGAAAGLHLAAGAVPLFAQAPLDGAGGAAAVPGGARIPLDRTIIVADPDPPASVGHRLEELRAHLQEITGSPVPLETTLPEGPGTVIVVGPKPAGRILGEEPSRERLGDEGFLIRSVTAGPRTRLVNLLDLFEVEVR